MNPRIPVAVQPLLKNYIQQTKKQLPGLIEAFYLVGSIALDEFNERFSDIDFLAIVHHEVTSLEMEQLRRIHQSVEKNDPRWKMSGSYIQASDPGKRDEAIRPHPRFHDGVLHPRARHELNWVTWWELKNRGISVFGPPAHTLPYTVDWEALLQQMRENLNSYWRSWSTQPRRMAILYSNWGVQWAVLGVLRQFYTLRENSITTKVGAARYALQWLPEGWHRLIKEAIRIRVGKASLYRLKFVRMVETLALIRYIVQVCNSAPSQA